MILERKNERYERRLVRSKKLFIVSVSLMLVLSLINMIIVYEENLEFDYLDPSEDVIVIQFFLCFAMVGVGLYSVMFRHRMRILVFIIVALSLTMYFILKSSLMNIANILYSTREENPIYIQILKTFHIICTGAAAYLGYQIRDTIIISENLVYYNMMQTIGNPRKRQRNNVKPPYMFWIPYCSVHRADGNTTKAAPAGDKRCIVCQQDLGPVVDIHEEWFNNARRPAAYFASVSSFPDEDSVHNSIRGSTGSYLNDEAL